MRASLCSSTLLVLVTACGFPRPPDVPGPPHHIGGQVHGLWQGADGVALRLQADGVDNLLTVPADGDFSFTQAVPENASYTVTIATNPAKHSCTVDARGNGTIVDADVMAVSIACTGPAVTVALSGQWGWTFDPLQETQMFSGSIVAQDVALTISGSDLTGANVAGSSATIGAATPPIALPLGSKMITVALTAGRLSKTYQLTFDRGGAMVDQLVYGKASNSASYTLFGVAIAISGDTLAVGGIANTVYIFTRSGATWSQQITLTGSNTESGDFFGEAVALSGDTLAVGAPNEDSSGKGVNSTDQGNGTTDSGAVYVFARNGSSWNQQGYIKASNTGLSHHFGNQVALLDDTLAVGAPDEAGISTGINHDQTNNPSFASSGAVYVFVRGGTNWSQQAYIKASNTGQGDGFGANLALSTNVLAVGASGEDSSATDVNNSQTNEGATDSGAVYVFSRASDIWTQQAYVKASDTTASQRFGSTLSVFDNTLAVGTSNGRSAYLFNRSGAIWTPQSTLTPNTVGVSFNGALRLSQDMLVLADSSDMVSIFARAGTGWQQAGSAAGVGHGGTFGNSITISGDTLAVGDVHDTCNANGINPSNCQYTSAYSGAIYIFR